MKRVYLMKGMAALAMGLVVVSCNKTDFDQNAYQQAKVQESKESFPKSFRLPVSQAVTP